MVASLRVLSVAPHHATTATTREKPVCATRVRVRLAHVVSSRQVEGIWRPQRDSNPCRRATVARRLNPSERHRRSRGRCMPCQLAPPVISSRRVRRRVASQVGRHGEIHTSIEQRGDIGSPQVVSSEHRNPSGPEGLRGSEEHNTIECDWARILPPAGRIARPERLRGCVHPVYGETPGRPPHRPVGSGQVGNTQRNLSCLHTLLSVEI